MDEEDPPPGKKDFRDQAVKKGARKLKARRTNAVNAWWGFSLFGMVGWSVVIPTLIGIFAGVWLDRYYADSHYWTLVLLLSGIFIGCVFAFILLAKEMFKKEDD